MINGENWPAIAPMVASLPTADHHRYYVPSDSDRGAEGFSRLERLHRRLVVECYGPRLYGSASISFWQLYCPGGKRLALPVGGVKEGICRNSQQDSRMGTVRRDKPNRIQPLQELATIDYCSEETEERWINNKVE